MPDRKFRLEVFRTASLCRNFEDKVFQLLQNKTIQIPTYLSAGQEYIPASIAQLTKHYKPQIFGQHRAHSTYLSFGGNIDELIDELLGRKTGCANGMGGSASIQGKEIAMYGHDGLMGSQVPIAVGACYANKKPTIAIMGDASAEEDYVLAAIAWASTKKLPILFVVEDNNLSILTEKKIRRNWNMHEVAKGFSMEGFDLADNPKEIKNVLTQVFQKPILININTHRLYWHAGSGIDDPNIFDRYKHEMDALGEEAITIHKETKRLVEEKWQQRLEIQ